MKLVDELEALFWKYSESFGLSDERELDDQVEFEDKFKEIICKHKGHKLYPDQCGILAHDCCAVCGVRREEIKEGVVTNCHGDVTSVTDDASKPTSFISDDFRT